MNYTLKEIITVSILFIIVVSFLQFSKTIEGLSFKSINDSIINYDEISNANRTSARNKSIVCCNNYTYEPTVKCVKQINQGTCVLPNSDGSCSGSNYTNIELNELNNGSKIEACKIPQSDGMYYNGSNTQITTIDNLDSSLLSAKNTKKKDISIGNKVTFKYNSWKYDGYVINIESNNYTIRYIDKNITKIATVKRNKITAWESGKIYLDNLFYSGSYGPNNYAFFSKSTNKCCFDAPEKQLNSSNTTTIPEKYQCPIGWDLVTNVCTDTCSPCTNKTPDTPKSETFPNKINSTMKIEGKYLYKNIIDGEDLDGYNTYVSGPFLL
tara:strand:- start:3241 stop:4215 length:975 start_codon:yes stop_codon:yes gene_type:complete